MDIIGAGEVKVGESVLAADSSISLRQDLSSCVIACFAGTEDVFNGIDLTITSILQEG